VSEREAGGQRSRHILSDGTTVRPAPLRCAQAFHKPVKRIGRLLDDFDPYRAASSASIAPLSMALRGRPDLSAVLVTLRAAG
jgi:hypothetical protein